ncbi:MAG: hypothetical protein U0S50_11405 [Sphingopyxis sp.]|uniref:hypothetical protein n=1 Tax=Sphingopyxis sp. TaxID=1908224 RepID=UPI002AB98627|nr:hypothetical protein [Sphingopyxis sp.]MDZ3832413.1 hypothetical protein [Sphingopyxis sp.]
MRYLAERDGPGGLAARLLFSGAVLYLSACGQPSGADASSTANRSAMGSVADTKARAVPAATSQSTLPIAKGLYTFGDGCAFADNVFFYDGQNTGEVGFDDSGHWTNGALKIARVGPAHKPLDAKAARAFSGYTLAWSSEGDREGYPSLALKPTGPGRFTHLSLGSFGELQYEQCAFAELSPKMQAALRAEQPQMAGGSTARVAAQSRTAFPPIPKGYYAVGSTCAQAIANFENDPFGLTFIDERKMLTAGLLLHEITKFEEMKPNRFRLKMRTQGEDGKMHPADMVVTLTGPSSFVSDDSAPPMGNHTHCPNDSVPKSIRDQFASYGR